MVRRAKCAPEILEVDQKMWPRSGKRIEEVKTDKDRGEAAPLSVRRGGSSGLRAKGPRASATPEAKPGESAGKGHNTLDW